MPPRTRNLYDPKSKTPYKLSRSKIELFVRCPRCFYFDRRVGVGRPQGPAFTLNVAVDTLLKKEFDVHRAKQTAHPLMRAYGLKAVPFAHEEIDVWRENFKGLQFHHEASNFLVTGAIDDVWIGADKQLIVVDYKATSKKDEVNLDSPWQMSYKRQMDIYQWLLRQNGFKVAKRAYFVYVNGRADLEAFDGKLEFKVALLPYDGNDVWINQTLLKMRKCLRASKAPKAAGDCEYCGYVKALTITQK